MPINIALDGPSGAGKSSLARRLAKELGFIHMDTGALYRTVGLYVLRQKVDMHDEKAVCACLKDISVKLDFVEGIQHVYLNGEDVTGQIRTQEVSMAASVTSAFPAVRAFLLELQRAIAAENNIIMDGRDIGTVILPNAQIKFFVKVDPKERARRRYCELLRDGLLKDETPESVLKEIMERDENDSTRANAPLVMAKDAVILDNSGEYEDTVATALAYIRERI